MTKYRGLTEAGVTFLIIAVCYLLAYGLTSYLITPIQRYFLPEITAFASLLYLPHGVRILATWYWGWKAIFPLVCGSIMASAIFNQTSMTEFLEPKMMEAQIVSACSAFVAFELARGAGFNFYARPRIKIHWKQLIAIGALASLINSIGSSLVYAGLIVPGEALPVFVTYLIGDVFGQFVCMFALMLAFRRIRTERQPM